MKGFLGVSGGTALICMLALVAGTADGASQPKRVAFRVSLEATVVKEWNTALETTDGGCAVTLRVAGRRTATLRSARPTTVLVTFVGRRVTYSPAAVRHVVAELAQSGTWTRKVRAPCTARTTHSTCARRQRTVRGASYRFFRSARDELSFRAARLPELSATCPRESATVRAIRPSLQEAEGELSEAALANPRISSQTASGSAELETDLEGAETGSVVERVHWELTFTRKRS